MLKRILITTTILAASLLSGCASHLTAEQSAPTINLKSLKSVSIAILDKREYVLSGDKEDNFEGIIRSGFGIPYSQETPTLQPLSVYLSERLVAGFAKYDIAAVSINTMPKHEKTEVEKALNKNENSSILFVLNEWKYDFHSFSDGSWYNFDLIVLDKKGKQLLVKNFSGDNDIPDNGLITNKMQLIYKARFEEVFQDPEVVNALSQ